MDSGAVAVGGVSCCHHQQQWRRQQRRRGDGRRLELFPALLVVKNYLARERSGTLSEVFAPCSDIRGMAVFFPLV